MESFPHLPGEILRWNFQRLGGEEMSDFLYDPHPKHYTGGQHVLKGWCAKIRWADKVMQGDYVHSMQGQPVYLENTGNSEWIEEPWPKNPLIRRLIVRATNPQGNQVEVSIRCDDPARPAAKIIWPMFDRWLQENDFKYLDVHFGIDQITSDQSEGYGQLAGQLEDRQMKNARYTVLADQCGEERRQLGKLLVAKRPAASEGRRRAKAIARLAALPDPDAGQRQELGRLKAGQTSARSARLAREQKIVLSDQRLDGLNEKLKTTEREVSRLDTLIAHGAVRLGGEKKYLMEVIKITARNLFYELLAPFKAAYDNFRDDHVWFRHLTRSAGLIELVAGAGPGPLRCHLLGTADYPKPVRQVAGEILAAFNAAKPQWPDGSGREFELLLGSKDAIQLAPSKP